MTDKPADDWYWATPANEPAGDRFVIANGHDELWARVRSEIDRDENCMWNAVHKGKLAPQLDDVLDMLLTVVPRYCVNHNAFMFEAAKIPVFAKFLRNARADLCNYVSDSCFPTYQSTPQRYSDANLRRLESIVSRTCDDARQGDLTPTRDTKKATCRCQGRRIH